jgi:hypothetical protein
VSEPGENASNGATDGSKLTPAKVSRFIPGSRLTTAIAAAAGGVLFWVWKTAGDQDHREAMAAARTLQGAARPADRVSAIRDLVRYGAKDGRLTIPALIACLNDADGSASAIGRFSPQCRIAVPALIEILEKEPLDLEKLWLSRASGPAPRQRCRRFARHKKLTPIPRCAGPPPGF